jgi:hypothetical protein
MRNHHYLVPEQREGFQKNLIHSVSADTIEDAEDWFVVIKERLLDVNGWRRYGNGVSADFKLTDAHGKQLNRHAHKGDYIKIAIPGSDSALGNEHDWMRVDAIVYDDYPDEDRETIAIRLRPALNPVDNKDNETAIFLDNATTCTIVIERDGMVLRSLYHRRNETEYTDVHSVDAVSNVNVALNVWFAVPDWQWADLVKGLLEV